jgi:hypothetical protein
MTATNRYRDGLLAAARLVPQNWLDPLLTGPKAIIGDSESITAISLGVLLNAIVARIEAAARAAEKPKQRKRARGKR